MPIHESGRPPRCLLGRIGPLKAFIFPTYFLLHLSPVIIWPPKDTWRTKESSSRLGIAGMPAASIVNEGANPTAATPKAARSGTPPQLFGLWNQDWPQGNKMAILP